MAGLPTEQQTLKLSLGPVLFNWEAETWRDFYFRMADEAPVDTVFVGETVCSKRLPFLEPHIPDVVERLQEAGKEVILSGLSVVMNRREEKQSRSLGDASLGDTADEDTPLIEANDISMVPHLKGHPFAVGPFINVYNEGTLTYLAEQGATRFCLPQELSAAALREMGRAAEQLDVALEVQAYGRVPLALSARCYHARAHGLAKDNCQFVCDKDPDGMELDTMEDQPFLSVNGIQTLSHSCLTLVDETEVLAQMGIGYLRISPHSCDMVAVCNAFSDTIAGKISSEEAMAILEEKGLQAPFANGFYNATEGHRFVA